ncbi:MAG: HEAT repeat domain-containing protein [Planctomycetota bacterium]|jgi:hypothetical protein
MNSRRLAVAVALLPLLFLATARAAIQDDTADAVSALRNRYNRGVAGMTPEEVDKHRSGLLEPVVASGSLDALDAVLMVAKDRCDKLAFIEKRTKKIDERLKEIDEAAKEKEKDGEDGSAGSSGRNRNRNAKTPAELEEEKATYPKQVERETRWQVKLQEATATLVDGLPTKVWKKGGSERIRKAMAVPVKGYDTWLAEALGGSRKPRTGVLLVEIGADALGEYRDALKRRQGPAKELSKVTSKINELLQRYLDQQAKQGNYPDKYPVSILGNYPQKQQKLRGEVARYTGKMESAEARRLSARSALGTLMAAADEEMRSGLLDIVESDLLSGKDFMLRSFGLGALGPVPGDRAFGLLETACSDPSALVVVSALDAVGEREEAGAVELLASRLYDPRWQVRAAAASSLGKIGRATAVPPLLEALDKSEARTLDDLKAALVSLTGKKFPPVAEVWNRWWATADKTFRGPKDPKREGGETAKKDDAAKPADGTPVDDHDGESVSFYGIETRSERLLFILDFSGSMTFPASKKNKKRKKVDVLKEELKRALTGLPDGSTFNIVAFSVEVRQWKKKPQSRDGKTLKDALKWVDKQKVVGSTNIYGALEKGFGLIGVGAAKDKNYQPVYDTVFFMTDGKPTAGKTTDTKLILGDVKRWNEGKKVRVHVIGMGGHDKRQGQKDLDEDFLKDLAKDNSGECVIR